MIRQLLSLSIGCVLVLMACRSNRSNTITTSDSTRNTAQAETGQLEPSLRVIRLAPSPAIRAVSLVDSTLLDFGSAERSVYRVAVHHESAVDTLPDVLTIFRPTLVGDSIVLGVAYDSTADVYSLFSYSAPKGQIIFYSPPDDLRLAVSVPGIAPDGKELAYVGFPGDETGSGIVRRWPAGEIVVQTARVTVPATDIVSGWASWADTTHFEFDISISDASYARILGVRGQVDFKVDTLIFPAVR